MDYRLIDFFSRLENAASLKDAWAVYLTEMQRLGFQEGLISIKLNHGSVNDVWVTHEDYRPDFYREYQALGGLDTDATAQWCLENDGLLKWHSQDDALLRADGPQENQLQEELSADYGIRNGVCVALTSQNRRFMSGIGLSATGINDREYQSDILIHHPFVLQAGHLLQIVAQRHLRTYLLSDTARTTSPLSADEYEVLHWLVAGLRPQQIADEKLYRSLDRINQHIAQLKRKLDVATQEQLITKALSFGMS